MQSAAGFQPVGHVPQSAPLQWFRHVHAQPPLPGSLVPLTAVAWLLQLAGRVQARKQCGKPAVPGTYPSMHAPQLSFGSTLAGQYWHAGPYHAFEHTQVQLFGGVPVGGKAAWLLQLSADVHTGSQFGYPP